MFLAELLFALGVAILFTVIFTMGLKRPGPWPVWWAFFLIIFLAAWAGSLWITPAGPVVVGVYWLPVIMVSFIIAVLLAAVTPPDTRRSKVKTISEAEQEEAVAEKVLDVFFWILLGALALIIIIGYFMPAEEVVVASV